VRSARSKRGRGDAANRPEKRLIGIVDMFAFCSPILDGVWNLPDPRLCDYTVRCKVCGENVPAPVETMPSSWIIGKCPLCGECRYYLPSEVFRGRLSVRLHRKPVRSERQVH
jgi:flavoprotein